LGEVFKRGGKKSLPTFEKKREEKEQKNARPKGTKSHPNLKKRGGFMNSAAKKSPLQVRKKGSPGVKADGGKGETRLGGKRVME